MMTIRRAVPADLSTVLAVVRSVAGWLHAEGYDQWPDGSPSLSGPNLYRQIKRGEFWLVSSGADPAAVIAISGNGDADFWTPRELAEPAAYMSKAAVVRRYAGRGLGALLLRWACDYAAAEGARWARLDVWKTNADLQAYYQRQGWTYLRTVEVPGRNSGALFQQRALADPEARAAFTPEAIPDAPARPVLEGSPVIVATDDGPVAATVTAISGDWSHEVAETGWEHGTAGPPRIYTVEREGKTFTAYGSQVWADPATVAARLGRSSAMTDGIIDLSKPTGYFEVSVWHYSDDRYSVDTDRGLGRLTVYETDSKDKALGVAEYIESERRYDRGDDGETVTNEGEPFTGSIVHWDCGELHDQDVPGLEQH